MKIHSILFMCCVTEGVYFHSIGNSGCCEGSVLAGMMQTLSFGPCVLILIKLLCSTSHLMVNETSYMNHESDCTIWRLKFYHISRMPPHLVLSD